MKYLQPQTNNRIPICIATIVYVLLGIISLNYCYFWDNIQQISKEAHWFFLNDFSSLLMPVSGSGSEIVATGYHPPLMGIMTAFLWKLFGYKIWISHLFAFVWVAILFYNLFKLNKVIFPAKYAGWVSLLVLLEPTVLCQFVIASPDLILFTAFVWAIRALFDHKSFQLAIAIFFLCGINMRGVFLGTIFFSGHVYYSYSSKNAERNFRFWLSTIKPYLPTLLILSSYYIYYFMERGWFFSNSAYSEHYSMPSNLATIIKHFLALGLRLVENGRFMIWILGLFVVFRSFRTREKLSLQTKVLFLIFTLLLALYLLFVGITKMPFASRYFIPLFFLLTLLTASEVIKYMSPKKIKFWFFIILALELSGHLWIYPKKISKSWDGTLAHISYYELRNECFNYLDSANISYSDVSAGFCLYGNRQIVELFNKREVVETGMSRRYFIYSNISNLEDDVISDLDDQKKWEAIRRFEKGFVEIIIYERTKKNFAITTNLKEADE